MKRKLITLLLCVLCVAILFSGCSASKNAMDSSETYSGGAANDAPMAAQEEFETESGEDSGVSGLLEYNEIADENEKIIYSARAELESLEFDESIKAVYEMIDRYGGFIESSSVSGTDYSSQFYGYKNYRSAEFTIRVPRESFADMMNSLGDIGNVTYSSTQAENITSQFTDTESRLNMYKAEEERLLTMLESAATVEDMITVESRLSEVRYNIESLTSQLNNWQKQIDYSTVTLSVREVEKLTQEVPVQRTYWQQVGDSLSSVLKDMGEFFKDFLRIFIAALPVLIVCAVIAGIVLAIVFGTKKARKKRRAKKLAEKTEDKKD